MLAKSGASAEAWGNSREQQPPAATPAAGERKTEREAGGGQEAARAADIKNPSLVSEGPAFRDWAAAALPWPATQDKAARGQR